MALQKVVNSSQAIGFAGKVAQGTHSYFNTIGAVAGDDITIGEFVQFGDEGVVKQANGKAISGKIAGLAVFTDFKDGAGDSSVVTKGNNVTILNAGSAFIATNLQAKQGQAVLLKTNDGSLVFDTDKAKASHTFTGFVVAKGNTSAVSGIVEITTAGAQI